MRTVYMLAEAVSKQAPANSALACSALACSALLVRVSPELTFYPLPELMQTKTSAGPLQKGP